MEEVKTRTKCWKIKKEVYLFFYLTTYVRSLPKDFKTPMEYYLELTSGEKKVQDVFEL